MIDQNKIKEFKKLRNYFRENDKHTFAHYAYTFLDELIKEYDSNQVQAGVKVQIAEIAKQLLDEITEQSKKFEKTKDFNRLADNNARAIGIIEFREKLRASNLSA